MTSTAGVGQAGNKSCPYRVDRLIQQGADIAAAFLQRVEQGHAGRTFAVDEVVDEGLDDLGISEAEEIADLGLVDPFGCGRQQLIEHGLRVAHAARSQPRDEVHGRTLGDPAIGGEDAVQLALDLGDRQAPDVEALEARQDRRRELRGFGRREHEDDEVGWLLQRLEQCVPGWRRDLVRLVEDVDLAAKLAGRIWQALAQAPDLIDAAVAGCVDLDHVERRALPDRNA